MWRVLAVIGVLAAGCLAGCGGDGRLVIGVRPGQPGLVARMPDGHFGGFDIEVAHYVARALGYRDDQILYTADTARADLVVGVTGPAGSRPIAGPYLVTSTDVLVRADDLSIRRPRDLARKRVCATRESAGPLVARFGARWRQFFLAEANLPAACAPLLARGGTDAIVADAPVLAGLSAQYPGRFRFSGRPLSTQEYGIATSTAALRDQVNDALRRMFEDGSWNRAVIDQLGVLATRYTTPPSLKW
ncbi:transporter substrate-binding domain-containing protein [Microbispora sp. NBC_01189]|uniref:transporter substrate-binding domain-containing protein n=1 Tax=Microbispora sp. NBC_01189 TaxID=2903583 RepID=UPI002E116414|nr:transporter substrate-binding domain-containing protein [Microbispora sp. NBC_01189]